MVEMVGFRQVMWFVKLESDKDRILEVDTSEQHVPPRVRYGTACLLIEYDICHVSCSVEGDGTWCKRGHFVRETSLLQAGPCVRKP
jgi:hypothetical protein